ncbi:uncharacterized protein LOC117293705 [Asterias rubens]|uniref:uncharacterized protein LOC117293705 n=1 Tax=Asterias rubens TaxID=7604 RepID=UPI00145508D5|nr:uncharacterized protein LOC117293705 [Asterias rubens]
MVGQRTYTVSRLQPKTANHVLRYSTQGSWVNRLHKRESTQNSTAWSNQTIIFASYTLLCVNKPRHLTNLKRNEVSRDDHRYLKQVEMREEGGTPSIVGAVRAGLVFQLKEAIGADNIMAREHELCRKALSKWTDCTNLVLLGNTVVPRLPIFSFLIRHPTTGQFLHHNFVCAVLNDVFGLQARGGCACAGPYAQDLLGINEKLAKEIEAALLEDGRLDRVHLRRYTEYSEKEILRPGFVRINLPYFMSDDCVDFVIEAVTMAAQHAWKLLPQYIFNPETSEWKQRGHQVFQDRRWLGSINYTTGKLAYPEPNVKKTKGRLPIDYKDCLKLAEEIFKRAEKVRVQLPDQTLLFDEKASELRWFMLPSEARDLLGSSTSQLQGHDNTKKLPFEPIKYKESFRVDNVEKRGGQIQEVSLEERFAEEDRLKKSSEDLTRTLGGSVLEHTRILVSVESKDDCTSSCAELFLKTVEEGFVGESGDRWPESSTITNRTDDGVEGHRDDTMVDAVSDPRTDLLQESVCDLDKAASRNSSLCIGDKSGIERNLTSGQCRVSNVEEDLSEVNNLTKLTNIGINESLSRSAVAHPRPSAVNSSIVVTTPQTDSSAGNAALSLASEKIDNKPYALSPKSNHFVSNLDQLQKAGSNHPIETHHSVDSSVESDDKKPGGSTALTSSKEEDTTQVENGSVEPQRTTTGVPKKTESRKSGIPGSKSGFQKPPKNIFKPTVQALEEYKMIEDGDRVLVGLSGGKDSLSLLHTLRQYQFYAKSKGICFEIGGVTVDPQTLAYDPRPLIPYLANLGVPYFYEEQSIIDTASSLEGGCDSICSFCSRMKRGRLYACARREGYNVLAMGQHLDDLAESFLMSVFHNGLLRTMKANYTVKEGDLRVIRPFVYTRERDLRDFAEKALLPVIPENCPACFEAPKERHRTKQLLASQELLFPRLYNSLQAAMKPMMAKNRTGMESSRTKEDFFQDGEM